MKSAIYKITGPGGRVYIGQASNYELRWRQHRGRLRVGKHYNSKLQNAWNKYGEDAFVFEVVLLCPLEELDFYEQEAIDSFEAATKGYNIMSTARSCSGPRHPCYGKPNPWIAERSRTIPGARGAKRPDVSEKCKRRGPLNHNYGKRYKRNVKRLWGHTRLHPNAEEICRRLRAKESLTSVGKVYGISIQAVQSIKLMSDDAAISKASNRALASSYREELLRQLVALSWQRNPEEIHWEIRSRVKRRASNKDVLSIARPPINYNLIPEQFTDNPLQYITDDLKDLSDDMVRWVVKQVAHVQMNNKGEGPPKCLKCDNRLPTKSNGRWSLKNPYCSPVCEPTEEEKQKAKTEKNRLDTREWCRKNRDRANELARNYRARKKVKLASLSTAKDNVP